MDLGHELIGPLVPGTGVVLCRPPALTGDFGVRVVFFAERHPEFVAPWNLRHRQWFAL